MIWTFKKGILVLFFLLILSNVLVNGLVCPSAHADYEIRKLGTCFGRGGVLATVIGPGPQPGTECLYASHIYGNDAFELVAINRDTGKVHVYASPLPSESGTYALTFGSDGLLYLGTLPNGYIFRFNPTTGAFDNLGRAGTESIICQFAEGNDGKIIKWRNGRDGGQSHVA